MVMLVMYLPWRIFVYSSVVLFSSGVFSLVFMVGFFFSCLLVLMFARGGWGVRGVGAGSGCWSGSRGVCNRRRGVFVV